MYGAIPDVVISKPPRQNQCRVVVALGVGVMIGALGTTMLFPVTTKETEHPTPAPRPILAMDGPEIEMSEDLLACRKQVGSCYAQLMACASTSRPVTTSLAAMELDAQSHGCSADAIKYFQDHAVNVAFSVCSERCGQNPCLSLFPN